MKHTLFLLALISITFSSASFGQKMVTLQFDEKTDFMVQEIGAILHQGKDGISVTRAADANIKATENKDADLKEGDEVIMINGTRPKNIKEFRKLYNGVSKGEEVKLGIKRDGSAMIVTIHKVGTNPNFKMMTMNPDDMKLLPGIGFIDDAGNTLKLKELPPNPDVAKASLLKIGDIFKEMNGKNITSFEQFKSLYAKIKSGESYELTIIREGKEQILSIKKPEGRQPVMMKRGKP